MSSRLALAMLLVRDVPRCKAFYGDLLGFQVVPELSSPNGDFFFMRPKTGTTNIALQDANVQNYGVPVPAERGGVVLGFEVDDADAVYKEWQGKSVEIMGDVMDMGAGRMFTVRDPEGNYVQVYHLYPQVRQMQQQMGMM